jgi:hypothetical protein
VFCPSVNSEGLELAGVAVFYSYTARGPHGHTACTEVINGVNFFSTLTYIRQIIGRSCVWLARRAECNESVYDTVGGRDDEISVCILNQTVLFITSSLEPDRVTDHPPEKSRSATRSGHETTSHHASSRSAHTHRIPDA